jgi:hypothetical protein
MAIYIGGNDIQKIVRYLVAQPATDYYVWQIETMIVNFMEMGVNPNHIDVVCSIENGIVPDRWRKLAERYPARFFFYDDTREQRNYVSSIRPHILAKHFKQRPEVKSDVIFYHDSDILFTKPPKEWITSEMINDEFWYGSDTKWYIAHSYIIQKGQDVMDKMCEIMELPESLIRANENNAIGAQYLMKDIDEHFWERCELDAHRLFTEVTDLNNQKIKEDPTHHPLQIWCADMWAVLWGAWRLGKTTICHDNFLFSWGTSDEAEYHRRNIFHNAGVLNTMTDLFYKGDFINKLPYGQELNITPKTASYKYWEWIQKTASQSCII